MSKWEIVQARDLTPDVWYLTYADWLSGDEETRPVADPTAADLGLLCDDVCENGNLHDLVNGHAVLADVIARHIGEEKAAAIMRDVAGRGGLLGMARRSRWGPKEDE